MLDVLTERRVTPARDMVERFLNEMIRAPKQQSILDFAESEIVIPDGDFKGLRYNARRIPYAALFLNEVQRWPFTVVTGCTQSGKTLTTFIIPVLYAIFGLKENVIAGVPDEKTGNDKWEQDLLPAIEASWFREMLPASGKGSRGGNIEDGIKFEHGPRLKIMTAGGGDKGRAHFTSRCLFITETDGFERAGGTSKESSKLTQIEGRTLSYSGAGTRWHILECTVTDTEGPTWDRYQNASTCSRLAMPCHACGEYVTLLRENLIGWQDAVDVLEARDKAEWVCGRCGSVWNEDQHIAATRKSVLVHKGQEVLVSERPPKEEIYKEVNPGVYIVGPVPRTDTLGFRWSAPDNLFFTAASVAAEEWKATRADNPEDAEIKLKQQFWAIPTDPAKSEVKGINYAAISTRIGTHARNTVPEDARYLTAFMDLGTQSKCHWGCMAFGPGFTPYVVEFGVFAPSWHSLGEKKALLGTMAEFYLRCKAGFGNGPDDPSGPRVPDKIGIDLSGSWAKYVYEFCREHSDVIPCMGAGESQQTRRKAEAYRHPTKKQGDITLIGEDYFLTRIKAERCNLMQTNADAWKTFLWNSIQVEFGEPGAYTLFRAALSEFQQLIKHYSAETVQQIQTERGFRHVWTRKYRHNHDFDVGYNCCALGHLAGARLVGEAERRIALPEYASRRESTGWKIGR